MWEQWVQQTGPQDGQTGILNKPIIHQQQKQQP